MTDESLRGSIVSALKEIKERETEGEETESIDVADVTEVGAVDDRPVTETKTRDGKGKFVKKDTPPGAKEVVHEEKEIEPPKSWADDKKAKFKELPPDVREYILQREDDVHKQFTKQDEERLFGKQLRDVITPYMPIITSEGGNPAVAVQSLLNTAYLLRTGTAQQKTQLLQQIAKQYDIDVNAVVQPQQQVDPYIKQIEDRLAQFEQKVTQQTSLQERQEYDKHISEVNAFAANPEHKYFEQVKPQMAPLLASNQAKDLQEAYDMACWANPAIRSTLIEAQDAERAAKRKEEMEAKRRAAVSVTGSPAKTSGNALPQRDLREELREQLRSARGSKI